AAKLQSISTKPANANNVLKYFTSRRCVNASGFFCLEASGRTGQRKPRWLSKQEDKTLIKSETDSNIGDMRKLKNFAIAYMKARQRVRENGGENLPCA
ncbi:hypothetical protein DCC62_11555, partial [candidate division KSB1 bacterium]